MRTTRAALAAALLGCGLPVLAQKDAPRQQPAHAKQPAREPAPPAQAAPSSPELDQARLQVRHAELDVAAAEEAIKRAEEDRSALNARIAREGGDTSSEASNRADAAITQARERAMQARQALEHRRLDVEAQERRAQEMQRAGALSLEFRGGTVADYIGALSTVSASPVNIIVTDPQIASAEMGPVSLRAVTVETAVRVIPSAAMPRSGRAVSWDVSRIDDQHGAPVFRLRPIDSDRPNGLPIVTEVVSLAGVSAGGTDAKAALSAVDAALGLIEAQGQPPEIKYHPESGLLIVRGTPPQVSTVRDVVSQMTGDSERKRSQEVKRATARIASEMQARKLRIQGDRAAAELAAAEAEYKDIKQMHEAGTMSPAELRAVELKVAQARAGAQMIEAEMVAAQRQAELGGGSLPGEDPRPADGGRGAPGAADAERDAMIQQLRAMVEDLKAQNEALQQQLRALQAGTLKKDKPAGR